MPKESKQTASFGRKVSALFNLQVPSLQAVSGVVRVDDVGMRTVLWNVQGSEDMRTMVEDLMADDEGCG